MEEAAQCDPLEVHGGFRGMVWDDCGVWMAGQLQVLRSWKAGLCWHMWDY